MSGFVLSNRAWAQSGMSGDDILVMYGLASYADRHGVVNASHGAIAKACGRSRETISRRLPEILKNWSRFIVKLGEGCYRLLGHDELLRRPKDQIVAPISTCDESSQPPCDASSPIHLEENTYVEDSLSAAQPERKV